MPKSLESKPEVFEDVLYCAKGFMILSGSRANWHNYINVSDIKAYCEMTDIEDMDFFLKAIREMDHKYLEKALERHKNANRSS